MGAAAGASGSVWAQRRLRQRIERYAPEQIADRAAASARRLGTDVKSAAEEGRVAMREREDALRSQFRPPAR